MTQFHQPTNQNSPLSRTIKSQQTHSYSYFYSSEGKDFGPYSLGQMLEFRESGKINYETLVVREGDKEWRILSEFGELSKQ